MKNADEQLKIDEYEKKKSNLQNFIDNNYQAYKSLLYKAQSTMDPLEALNAFIIRAIYKYDLLILDDAKNILASITDSFVSKYNSKIDITQWDPCAFLVQHFLEYIIEMLQCYIDMFDSLSLDYGVIKILDISQELLTRCIPYNTDANEIKYLLNFWKTNAYKYMVGHPKIFNHVCMFYDDLSKTVFYGKIKTKDNILDEVYRHIGVLGEKLLNEKKIEKRPLTYDNLLFSEYDHIANFLTKNCNYYVEQADNSYPLVYFDTVFVIFTKYIENNIRMDVTEEHICKYIEIFSSFSEEAIKQRNANGGALAIYRLVECYQFLIKKDYVNSAKLVVSKLIKLYALAFVSKENIKYVSFLTMTLDQYLVNFITNCPYIDTISLTLQDILLRPGADNAELWEAVKSLGKKMQSNFGLRFDFDTDK